MKYRKRDIKQPFFFPSLLFMFVDSSCLYLKIPPVNLLQKYSQIMRKRKILPGIWVWQMKNSIVVVWLVQTFQSVVLTNKSYWLSYKKLSENIVYVSGTVSIVPRTTAVVRSHNSRYAHVQQLMCMRSTAAVHPLDISKREYRILSLKAVMLVV